MFWIMVVIKIMVIIELKWVGLDKVFVFNGVMIIFIIRRIVEIVSVIISIVRWFFLGWKNIVKIVFKFVLMLMVIFK